MKNIMFKIRTILKNLFVALGATTMPYLFAGGYAMQQIDPELLTVPFEGRVVSEETGEPIAGISIIFDYRELGLGVWPDTETDGDGRFLVYVPETEKYSIDFIDYDGFENGYFPGKSMDLTRNEIENPLAVTMNRESQSTIIHGTVLSIGEPISGIIVGIRSGNEHTYEAFSALSDNDGNFSIQVPKYNAYSIQFSDRNWVFQAKNMTISADEIKQSLKVELEKVVPETSDEATE
jgi:hypothetical protein